MRKIRKTGLAILSLLTAAIFVGCGDGGLYTPDLLGGGGTGSQTEESPIQMEQVPSDTTVETPSEDKTETTVDGAIKINLSALETQTDYYTYTNDALTITAAGVYELSGTLDGAVVVDGVDGDVRLILNGATVNTKATQNCAALVFSKTSGKRVLTVAENSVNVLADSTGDASSDGDADCAVIQAKKCSLTVNGKGTLTLTANGDESTGLKVKKDLDILGTTLIVNATDNGIKSGELMNIQDANITVTAGNDGIKTDVEATTQDEADEYAANAFAGYVYIKNSNINVISTDDGIAANSLMKIENTSANTITVKTNGGAPSTITETSSDNADGKGIRVSGITLVEEGTGEETDIPSTTETGYMLAVSGGVFDINSNDDALTSMGNLLIGGGTFTIATGDDGIHAEYLTKISGGDITVSKCYEGIEGAQVEIYGGTVNVTSTDDGINAANSDLSNYAFNIYIGGGNVTVNAQGDGVDSNGTMEFAGGTTVIYGPTGSDNAALDADKGILVNGGNVIALGSSGMVETPSSNSERPFVVYNMSSSCAAGATFKVTDGSGNVLYETASPKKFQSAVVSLTAFEQGSAYTLSGGSQSSSVTISGILHTLGQSFGGGGGRPGGFGW